jgi:DsbC/DsbD-like thiol-disulfide interchange protein
MHRLALAALIAITVTPAAANPPEGVIAVEVLPGWRTPAGTHMAGLRFTLAPGWKTYWRAPGDAGIAPLFVWSGSRNVADAVLHWPVPEVSYPNGTRTIGYADEVVIPVEVTPAGPGAPLRLEGTVELGVCSDICMPMTLSFGADLPADGERDAAIVAALVDRPLTPAEAGVSAAQCRAVPTEQGLELTAALRMPPDGGQEVVVIEPGFPGIWVSEAETRWQDGWLTAGVEMIAADGGPVALDRSDLRITVIGPSGAVDIRGCEAG